GDPITITSFGDFERTFGGLWEPSTLGFAVRDFFQNGGERGSGVGGFVAGGKKEAPTHPRDRGGNCGAAPGWGGRRTAGQGDHDVAEVVAKSFGLQTTDLFNLTIRDTKTGVTEQFRNLTIVASPRLADKVLENESELVVVSGPMNAVPGPHGDPAPGEDIWKL